MLFFNLVFIVFTAAMPTLVTCKFHKKKQCYARVLIIFSLQILKVPLERKVLFREHLNHWYSLKAYYLAKLLADIPFQIIFPTVYFVIVYFMTGQPLSLQRFSMLLCVTICTSLVGQGVGLFFGTALSIQSAVFLGPTCAIPLFLFAGYFINLNSVPSYLSWISYISFFRYGFEGSMIAIYDYDRPPLECAQPYCYFRSPQKFLENFAMEQSSYLFCILGMLAYFIILRILGYFLLRYKLKMIR
jgi:ATP-binding cassette subfamily G (WHITE) protein 1